MAKKLELAMKELILVCANPAPSLIYKLENEVVPVIGITQLIKKSIEGKMRSSIKTSEDYLYEDHEFVAVITPELNRIYERNESLMLVGFPRTKKQLILLKQQFEGVSFTLVKEYLSGELLELDADVFDIRELKQVAIVR